MKIIWPLSFVAHADFQSFALAGGKFELRNSFHLVSLNYSFDLDSGLVD